ncbi:binding-protein-dependent transport systems inner membrane component [Paenibacillus vortex V453]|jgi:putative aldouronate transport system permease protein|uniref:Sugar ABC transporter permease n=2 Tax=Paenibacillus TaxID=44249 RepID=A0A163IIN2_9BACL|nr:MULTISPECIES: ABC transporter permease subunit [Paenibacillus]ANA79951.1 sugar ABC transporter permease [Paenibacillus glucanolyticus]AVV56024.1 sugar ABC transporter permease [Paenibacillus glucanolyticus]AWP30559.1 sugar ABC transporter permease [Paenibacillus sp. Cedars]EFU43662.1 binding-protein-dependent transport systems inner membrane component [Paenibacillus vortex V453]ETT38336.1 binding-protein-dependent transport systems inner membrane component [Paenibacillus sp. FSL R5-808]
MQPDGKSALSPDLSVNTIPNRKKNTLWRRMIRNWELYLFIAPAFLYFVIFHYGPMYGIQIAFKNFIPTLGVTGSPWVGFDHFVRFFNSYYFWDLLWNTLSISLYELAIGFPLPIILALAFNEVRDSFFKRTVQTVTYAPHFISVVVMSGMIITFLSPSSGMIVNLVEGLGFQAPQFLTDPAWFKTVYVLSGVWQSTGWGTIIYLAALSGVDPQLHEAAVVDGASRFKRILHINIPAIIPTITILLILNMGSILGVGFEKILLLQNPLNMGSSDVISTFVYRSGLVDAQYSFSTAVGLFNSVVNAILLIAVNQIARRTSENSLW